MDEKTGDHTGDTTTPTKEFGVGFDKAPMTDSSCGLYRGHWRVYLTDTSPETS